MSHKITVELELYERLASYAEGFDTPANVIEKLLNHYDNCSRQSVELSKQTEKKQKNFNKYSFNGHLYGKSRLVLAVMKDYVSKHPNITFESLRSIFPNHLQGSMGVFNKYDYIQEKLKDKTNKRHFVKPDEIIQLSDCAIVICTEWGIINIDDFIQQAEKEGYILSVSRKKQEL